MKTTLIVALCVAAMAITYAAIAQAPGPAQSIGVVNVDKVMADYEKAKVASAELETMGKGFDKQLDWMRQHALLNDAEITELVKIRVKDKPTPAEETRASALEDLDNERGKKLRSLQNQPNLTAQQKQELTELQGIATLAGKAIAQARKDFQKKVDARNVELTTSVGEAIKDAVGAISQEKNTPVVVNKSIVLQGGTDLTDAVIKKLNNK